MTARIRLIVAVLLTGAWTTGFLVAQGAGAPAPQTPVAGPGQPQGAQGPAAGRGRQGGQGRGRSGGFTQFTRPIAAQDVLVRGQALYETNCASCHATDLRGTADGKNPNLLRSGVALRDQHGELIGDRVARHTPRLTLIEPDVVAIAEYIHSVHATMSGQGSPPGRIPTNVSLTVLVGDAKAGAAAFAARCGSCHSASADLQGIATRFPDPRELQNGWVSGSTSGGGRGGRGGGRGGGGGGVPATVTLADGTKLDGTLVRQDDFLVIMTLADGTRRTFPRTDGLPAVEIRDPRAGHVNAIVKLAHEDTDGSQMHDITAYLWTIK